MKRRGIRRIINYSKRNITNRLGRRPRLAQQTKYALLKAHYLAGKIFHSSEIKNRIWLAQQQACGEEYVRLTSRPRIGIRIPAGVRALGGYPNTAGGLPR